MEPKSVFGRISGRDAASQDDSDRHWAGEPEPRGFMERLHEGKHTRRDRRILHEPFGSTPGKGRVRFGELKPTVFPRAFRVQ